MGQRLETYIRSSSVVSDAGNDAGAIPQLARGSSGVPADAGESLRLVSSSVQQYPLLRKEPGPARDSLVPKEDASPLSQLPCGRINISDARVLRQNRQFHSASCTRAIHQTRATDS